MLCKNGFGHIWLFENVSNEKFVLSEIKSRLTDVFIQTCFKSIMKNKYTLNEIWIQK